MIGCETFSPDSIASFGKIFGQKIIVSFWIKSLAHINLFTSLPFGRLSPDPLSSIADSPESPGQQSPRRSNISIPKTAHGDRKICHGPRHPCSEDIS
jgi:hypothetical protein